MFHGLNMIVISIVGNMYILLSCYIHDMFIATHCASLTLSRDSCNHANSNTYLSCTKILLMFCMRPATITLNYSIKNIRNGIRQIYIHIIAIQLTSSCSPQLFYSIVPMIIITHKLAQLTLVPQDTYMVGRKVFLLSVHWV